ncbi:lipoprotein ABC transporter ATP-binding protein [Candidatus Phytoplasma luffae]|uniref:Lipoprotein ABC transporter ATP-binding protein n=1 Tax=Loofah witches'-broom phytoplasma TaxID=35773 RepID=A0A975FIZ1_LOWBP|nr:ATP-binding cassette domain-containing protein [Candidatus Phytoplasma luffae]QTX02744.1 lipoprotein ABC transporter ATP-binding protein [Candidatus Phytoplasma luffae]
MIDINDLSKNYYNKKFFTSALKNINLNLPNKGLIFILGKSGSGKSTLLNMIGCLDSIEEGDISIYNNSLRYFKQDDYDNYRNASIGFVFQDYNLILDLKVGENIALALQLQGKTINYNLISETLNKLEIQGFEDRRINQLSGGQQQRVTIARALIKNSDIILCDEPTGNLDSKTSKIVFELFKELSKNKLIIIVSHDVENSFAYGDRVIEMKDGYIISDLSRDPFKKETKQEDLLKLYKDRVVTKELLEKMDQNNNNNNKYRKFFSPTLKNNLINLETKPLPNVKSHLPLKVAFKMGTSLFKEKKLFLFITVFLSTILYNIFVTFFTIFAYSFLINNSFVNLSEIYKKKLGISNIKSFSESFSGIIITFSIIIFFILLISFFMVGGFVKSTMKAKKKDIGILRSLGARKKDIFKIFINEGLIISFIISLCLGIILLLPIYMINWPNFFREVLNKILLELEKTVQNIPSLLKITNDIQTQVKYFINYFTLLSFVVVSNIILTSICIYPSIHSFAKKKPIDVILDR